MVLKKSLFESIFCCAKVHDGMKKFAEITEEAKTAIECKNWEELLR